MRNIWIATISTMFKGPATASSVRWRLRARRFTRSTGRPRKCRRGRAMKWRQCNLFNRLWRFEQNGNAGSIRRQRDSSRPHPPPPAGNHFEGAGAHTDSGALSAGCSPPISRFSPTFLMAISTPTTRGTPRTVPKWKSIPSTTPPNASVFRTFRAGPRCRT